MVVISPSQPKASRKLAGALGAAGAAGIIRAFKTGGLPFYPGFPI